MKKIKNKKMGEAEQWDRGTPAEHMWEKCAKEERGRGRRERRAVVCDVSVRPSSSRGRRWGTRARTEREPEPITAHELLVHHDDGHRREDVERPREGVHRSFPIILTHFVWFFFL